MPSFSHRKRAILASSPSGQPSAYRSATIHPLVRAQLATEGFLQNLPLQDQILIAAATQEAIGNFEAGLAEVPSEAKSLHGAFHVFEHKYLDFLL